MESKQSKNPSIPLTPIELRAIAGVRLSKQYNKRLSLVVIAGIVMAIAGVAFHRGQRVDVGFIMVAVAMAGFLAGAIVINRWLEREKAKFVKSHAGAFWVKTIADDAHKEN
jgi:hypothetical protein